jgi:hypothetical protein
MVQWPDHSWDYLYKVSVRKAGMNLKMYERYVDDSNQVAIVPPPGAKYDVTSSKVIIDDNLIDVVVCDDERTARVKTDIANSVMPGIVMEFNIPSRNSDQKMPILDMEVWIEKEEGNIMFQQYEKPTASKSIMHANSAQSASCRNCVHTQEILRRLLNSSPLLDWKTCVAPVLSFYMSRMMQSGYPEQYRVDTLTRAFRIYDNMVEEDNSGIRPLYRPKDWNVVKIRKEKEEIKKRKNRVVHMMGSHCPHLCSPNPK